MEEGYDGYSAVHRARTKTDLLLEPYSRRSRGCYVVVDVCTAVAPSTLDSGSLNAPGTDSLQIPRSVWPSWQSY